MFIIFMDLWKQIDKIIINGEITQFYEDDEILVDHLSYFKMHLFLSCDVERSISV